MIRRRVSYANVTATVALFFAVSGGAAYAASHYLITSTKQIKPSVLTQLKGKAGPAGPAGANGPAGTAGGQGSAGSQGPAGTNGTNGVAGESVIAKAASGTECKEGVGGTSFTVAGKTEHVCNGKPGTTGFTEALPAGKTEMGSFATAEENREAPEGTITHLPISFSIPLAGELNGSHVELVKVGATGTNCKGSAGAPSAPSGFLCVYLAEEHNIFSTGIIQSGTTGVTLGASTAGAIVEIEVEEGGENNDQWGTWAVTG